MMYEGLIFKSSSIPGRFSLLEIWFCNLTTCCLCTCETSFVNDQLEKSSRDLSFPFGSHWLRYTGLFGTRFHICGPWKRWSPIFHFINWWTNLHDGDVVTRIGVTLFDSIRIRVALVPAECWDVNEHLTGILSKWRLDLSSVHDVLKDTKTTSLWILIVNRSKGNF